MISTLNGAGRWVVVCDGAKALFLTNLGTPVAPRLGVLETVTGETATTADLGTDRPGRSFQSYGTARSAVEQTDWHDAAERDFLAGVAARLAKAAEHREVAEIVLVAPPRALGALREMLAPQVRDMVAGEMAKDLVKLPVKDIERHIAA